MTGTMAHRATVYFSRRQEYLSASTCCTVPRIALACAPRVPSRMEWAGPMEVGIMLCNSMRNIKTNVNED